MSYPPDQTPTQPSATPYVPAQSQGYAGAGVTAPLPAAAQGYPGQGYPPPAGPGPVVRRSVAGLIFGILSVLLFLALAGVSGLYVVSKSSADKKIADQTTQIANLNKDVTTANDKATQSQADLTAANDKVTTSEACAKAVRDFFTAINKNDDPGGEKAVLEMASNCEGASLLGN